MTDLPVTLVNRFHPKAGQREAFIALQIAESRRLGPHSAAMGWLGNRILRARDSGDVVIVSTFRSEAARAAWAASAEFKDHIALIAPLLDKVDSQPFDQVAGNGEV